MEMQMKEMMDAMLNQQKVQMDMQSTIQAQEARIEQLESQQAMGGPIAPTSTHVHSQQQSYAYTSSFNCHRSSEEVHISNKGKKKKKKWTRQMPVQKRLLEFILAAFHRSPDFVALLKLEVWAKEREVAGLRASLNTLMSEIQRLNKLCTERKEAEDSLREKWKKIEEFDGRRSELESIYNALLKANMDAAVFWSQQPLAARAYASSTIIPACTVVVELSNGAKDFIDKEVSSFYRSPDNSLYMLPSTPQALLESMGANGSSGPEAVAAAEKNAVLLTARAGARDPSSIPSICRISAALQYPAGLEGSDAGLASVLESLEFCLKHRGSEACVLEDLAKAINLVHIRRDLVESGHALLNHAYHAQQEYERTTNYCLNLAAEEEKTIVEKWLPELKSSIMNAQKCLEDCKYVRGLLDEWWEQPASTVVDWITVDGQNVAAWHNHVKQLLAFYDKELL